MAQADITRHDMRGAVLPPPAASGSFAVALVIGTSVTTLEGVLPVEYLLPGDRILTRAGMMPIASVTAHRLHHPDLVRIRAHALDRDRPHDDVLLAADQPIHLRDWRAKAMFGTVSATVALARLVDGDQIRRERPASIRTIRLGLPREAVIYVAGLEIASLPAAEALRKTA